MSTAPMSIGPYQIIEALGSGANGEVYLAEDLRLGRKVAIKTLSALGSKDLPDASRWMLREARAAARLNHPHIAGVYDVVESPDGAHIVMEYVRGDTLAFRVREGPLPPGQVLEIAIQLTDALAEAHAMGVVHRDLKPANVMITPKGDVKILDFGLAQVRPVEPGSTPVRSSRDFTLDGRQVGTPPYMPPEHLMGDPVDARGDLYSLGVMLYELLTGRRPFQGPDAMKLTMAILTERTPKASESNPAVPEALDAVVFRAMSRLPQERYASASELAADLRGAAAGVAPAVVAREGMSDAPTASRTRGWSMRVGRKRRVVSVVSLGLVVVLGVYGAVSRGRSPTALQSMGPPVVAVLPLAGMTGDAQDESLATGIADSLISTLSRLPGLTVVSRQATLPYRDRKKDTATIARELGATVVVDGAIQRSGEKVRVTLSLLRPELKTVEWSNTSDGSLREAFTLQSEVAETLADRLRLTVSAADRQRLQQPPSANMEALADYSQARTFLERPDVQDNLGRSIQLFKSAVLKDPRYARAHAGLGEAYWSRYVATRDVQWSLEARDAINEALRLDPNDSAVRVSLAAIYKGMGRTKEAIEELQKVTQLQPVADDAHQLLGRALVEAGRAPEGIAEIQTAIRLRPNYWGHYDALGRAYYGAGRYAEAVPAFRRVTELQPDNGWGFHMVATSYHAMDDIERALPFYQRSIQLGNTRSYSNLGVLYYHQGNYEQAAKAYQEAVKGEPNSSLKHHNLGDAYARLGRSREAREEYERAAELCEEEIRVSPRDFRPLARLGHIESKLGRFRDAERHVDSATLLAPANADVLYARAIILAAQGRVEASLAALQKAVQNGYSTKRAATDPDLAALRSQPGFKLLAEPHPSIAKER